MGAKTPIAPGNASKSRSNVRNISQETSEVVGNSTTNTGIFAAYAAELVRLDRSEGTINGYLADLASFANWFKITNGEDLTPEHCTPTDIREYRQRCIVQGLAPATINRRLSAIRAWLVFCEATGTIDTVPVVRSIKQSKADLVPHVPSRAEMNAITRAAERRGAQATAFIWLLRGTGCRISEAANARISQLRISPRSGEWICYGKGGVSRRIDLNASVRAALSKHLAARPMTSHDSVFVSRDRRPMTHWGLRDLWEAICRDARVENATPHSARHYAAVEMLTQTGDISAVQDALGHSHAATTMIYTRVSSSERRKNAFDKLSEED